MIPNALALIFCSSSFTGYSNPLIDDPKGFDKRREEVIPTNKRPNKIIFYFKSNSVLVFYAVSLLSSRIKFVAC